MNKYERVPKSHEAQFEYEKGPLSTLSTLAATFYSTGFTSGSFKMKSCALASIAHALISSRVASSRPNLKQQEMQG